MAGRRFVFYFGSLLRQRQLRSPRQPHHFPLLEAQSRTRGVDKLDEALKYRTHIFQCWSSSFMPLVSQSCPSGYQLSPVFHMINPNQVKDPQNPVALLHRLCSLSCSSRIFFVTSRFGDIETSRLILLICISQLLSVGVLHRSIRPTYHAQINYLVLSLGRMNHII